MLKTTESDLYYQEYGQGTALIFIHGLGLDSRIFNDQVEFFKNKFRVITFDLRGHGQSSAPQSGYSYNHFSSDLKALIDHLGLTGFHLVGLSMGGAIAARFALEYPGRAASLTFIGSHIVGYYKFENWPNTWKIARVEGISQAREIWKNFRLFENVKSDQQKYNLLSEMVDSFSCAPWLDPNPRYDEANDLKRLSEINIPALVTVGKEDLDFHPIAEILRDEIKNSKYVEFESGHLLSFEQPDKFNAVLEKFLAGLN